MFNNLFFDYNYLKLMLKLYICITISITSILKGEITRYFLYNCSCIVDITGNSIH